MLSQRTYANIALVGFMGTGKSTVGRIVAAQLGYTFLDCDAEIEARAGLAIAAIFTRFGEPAFRDMERQLTAGLESRAKTVIATGGGLVVDPLNLASLRKHAFIACLWARPEAIFQRVRTQTNRPLLLTPDPQAKIRELLTAREPFYKQADALICSEFRAARDVAAQVIHQYQLQRNSHR